MRVLGVDPGASGARAIVDMLDVPTLAISGWRLVDGGAVAGWLDRNDFDRAVLERVDARPTDGRGSIAQFARNAGGLAPTERVETARGAG